MKLWGENKYLTFAIVISAVVFLWFEVRPALVRRHCENHVLMSGLYSTTEFERRQLNRDMVKINSIEAERSKYNYSVCLHSFGVKD